MDDGLGRPSWPDARRMSPDSRPSEAALRSTAWRRGGVFTPADAARAGYSRARLRTALARGDWVVVRRGVMAEQAVVDHCASSPEGRHALATAADLAATDGQRVAVGLSAAAVLGVETLGGAPDQVSLSAPRSPGDGHGFRSSRTRTLVSYLPPEHRTAVNELGCATVERTVVDIARTGETVPAVVAMDSAARRFGVTTQQLREVAAFQAGWPFARRIGRAIDMVDPRSESVLETLGRLSWRFSTLPAPLVQTWIGENTAEVRVDLLVPELWVAGEGDGRLKYTNAQALWKVQNTRSKADLAECLNKMGATYSD